MAGERPFASAAFDQAAEQVAASHPSRIGNLGCAGAHQFADIVELGLGDDGGKRLFDPHRGRFVLAPLAPDQGAGVELVSENEVNTVRGPSLPRWASDAFVIEGAGDLHHPRTGLGHVEDALYDWGGIRIGFQFGTLLGTVLHHNPVEAVGCRTTDPEAAGGGLTHPPPYLLCKDIGYPIKTKESGTHGP